MPAGSPMQPLVRAVEICRTTPFVLENSDHAAALFGLRQFGNGGLAAGRVYPKTDVNRRQRPPALPTWRGRAHYHVAHPMEITEEQYARIKDSLPVQRGNDSVLDRVFEQLQLEQIACEDNETRQLVLDPGMIPVVPRLSPFSLLFHSVSVPFFSVLRLPTWPPI